MIKIPGSLCSVLLFMFLIGEISKSVAGVLSMLNKFLEPINRVFIFGVISLSLGMPHFVSADTTDDPCGGPSALLNLMDRPTYGDSVCVVPFKSVVLELGAQYQTISPATNYQENLPQSELRIGLPAKYEFFLLIPNSIHQSIKPYTGFTSTTGGIKHGIVSSNNWLASIETLVTVPSGTDTFGNNEFGVTVNGIANYTFNSRFNMTFLLAVSNQSKSTDTHRFTTINPDVVLSYVYSPKVIFFGEVYGQSKTSADMGSGFNSDAGVLYLLMPKFAIDFEFGHRISGDLGGFEHYLGAGIAAMF